jgi:hypothetical protein
MKSVVRKFEERIIKTLGVRCWPRPRLIAWAGIVKLIWDLMSVERSDLFQSSESIRSLQAVVCKRPGNHTC